MNFKTYADLSKDVKLNLHQIKKENFDLIVGIPRSGMIPAYMIALSLNLNCTTIQAYLNNDKLKHGQTRQVAKGISFPWEAKKVLVVDDSIATGNSLAALKESIPPELMKKLTFLAFYSSKPVRSEVDMLIAHVPNPRVFEWNIFHHPMLGDALLEMEGILCKAPLLEQTKTEEAYLDYINNVESFIIPNHKIHSIVTRRNEKYREQTEAWLKKSDVAYDNLIMDSSPINGKMVNTDTNYRLKVLHYKKSDTKLFFESEPSEARKLCKLAAKAVYCVANNRMYNPQLLDYIIYDRNYFPRKFNDLKIRYELLKKTVRKRIS